MKIDLIQDEIEEALVSYITTQGIDLSQKQVAVSLTAGRGPSGFTASVDIIKVQGDIPNQVSATDPLDSVEDSTLDSADGAAPIFQ